MVLRRRDFLLRTGGLVVGTLGLASLGWPELGARAMLAEAGLTAGRRATYRALVRAVGQSPETPVAPPHAEATLAAFERWFDVQTPNVRPHVEKVLDLIEGVRVGEAPVDPALQERPFSTRTPQAARALLASWSAERTPAERAFEAEVAERAVGSSTGAGVEEDLQVFLLEQSKAIGDHCARIEEAYGPGALELDPETGLPSYEPPIEPVHLRPEWPQALDSAASRRRHLAATAITLASLPLVAAEDDAAL
jgi:hypothetical protein